jgi:hypothetical protein
MWLVSLLLWTRSDSATFSTGRCYPSCGADDAAPVCRARR